MASKMEDGKDSIPLADDDAAQIPESEKILQRIAKLGWVDSDHNHPEDANEKAKLISQVLELQNTLDDLNDRVDAVKEENLKLRTENNVLSQYIENLIQASAVFQSVTTPTKSTMNSNSSVRKNLGTVIRVTTRAVQEAEAASAKE